MAIRFLHVFFFSRPDAQRDRFCRTDALRLVQKTLPLLDNAAHRTGCEIDGRSFNSTSVSASRFPFTPTRLLMRRVRHIRKHVFRRYPAKRSDAAAAKYAAVGIQYYIWMGCIDRTYRLQIGILGRLGYAEAISHCLQLAAPARLADGTEVVAFMIEHAHQIAPVAEDLLGLVFPP